MPIYPYSFQLPPLNVQDIPNDGVAGQFLGINGSGALDWLPVSAGGGDMLKSENLSGLADYPTARTNLGLGLTDSPTFKNLTISTGSITTSAPVTISQTWDAGAVAFTALKVNAVSTASAAASLLLDLQVGGVTQFSVSKAGGITASNALFNTTNARSAFLHSIQIGSSSFVGFTPNFNPDNGAPDTILLRDGAPNTLALRNGTNAQTFNVYGTYTASPLAYSRLAIACDTSGNATLTTQSTGTAGTVSINGVPVGLGKGNFASNIAIGSSALNVNTTGTNNTVIGKDAFSVGAGVFSESVAVGARALRNASGSCVAIGYDSLGSGGAQSVAVGWGTMNGFSCSDTIGMGWACLYTTQATSVIALGTNSGRFIANGSTANAVSTQSLFIGGLTKANASGETNQIVIGYDATGLGSNTAVLGNASITTTALRGNVGIGTTAPAEKLHVLGGKVLFGDPADATGTAGNGELTLQAWRVPQLNVACNQGSSNFFGLNLKAVSTTLAGFLVNVASGEIKIGGLSPGGYFPTFYSNNLERMRIDTAGNVGIGTTAPSSKLDVAGAVTAAGYFTATSGGVSLGANGLWQQATGHLTLPSTAILGWSAGANVNVDQPGVTRLQSEGSGILALRNGTNAQAFRIYNTYTDASNYERGYAQWTSNAFFIGYEAAGTGSTSRTVVLRGSSTGGVRIDNGANVGFEVRGGNFLALVDNTYDIGASGANRPRALYLAAGITAGGVISGQSYGASASGYFNWATRSQLTSPADGVIRLSNDAQNDFNRLQLGGTADTHPAIARDGAGIKITGAAAGLTSHIKVPAVAVASLPAAATAGVGARAFVNDATSPVFGSAVTGGGAVAVPVYSTGSAWNVG